MIKLYNNTLKYILLFFIGGYSYCIVEVISRGFTHISMLVAGGICFVLIGLLNERSPRKMALLSQMVISAGIITVVEFLSGLVVNVWLGLKVWDYSALPYNFMGQICLLYVNIWFFLSLASILMDDYLRYFLLGEEKPRYKVF